MKSITPNEARIELNELKETVKSLFLTSKEEALILAIIDGAYTLGQYEQSIKLEKIVDKYVTNMERLIK